MATLTKQHYSAFALMIRSLVSNHMGDTETLKTVAHLLAVQFSRDNPNFRRIQFLEACGFPEGEQP